MLCQGKRGHRMLFVSLLEDAANNARPARGIHLGSIVLLVQRSKQAIDESEISTRQRY